FPLVKDTDQSLAQSWKITRTAEVILVDAQNQVVYRGRVDDQYAPGITRSKTTREDLATAISSALNGKTTEIAVTEPVGCKIAYRSRSAPSNEPSSPTVNYADSIAAIFNKHCTECHRPGEIGPFDITNTDELQGWSEMILETIDTGRMPPWHADPAHGSFKNSRSISKEEIETVRQWVRAGAPLGDTSKLTPAKFADSGWRLGQEPDLVVPMNTKAYNIPATGTVDYQYFVVDPKITEDRWVSSAQVIPGDPSVVHHAIVFIRPPDDAEFIGIGWLTAYVPGQMATRFPEGYARKIPAGSKFVFQMHYTPNGRPTSDLSKIGLRFVDEPTVTHEVFTVVGIDQDFEIPPGANNHSVTARVPRFPKDGELLAVSPHMHVRGKAFELRARRGQATDILLNVPHYDFNWQHTYEWTDRIPLADVDGLEFTATFDNSDANPTNPAPGEYVMWGDQTWEEMAVAFFEVSRPRNGSGNLQSRSIAQRSDRDGDSM
ncbi:MAG: alkyl hydroperoxide reductase, partial [Pirellula sp.]